jgi:hypothetical protein
MHRAEKLHSADGCEQEKRARAFRKTRGGGNPGSLRECLSQNDSRDDWIARKVTGEDWIIVRENSRAFGRLAGFAVEQLPNEYERGAMGKAKKVTSDQWRVTSYF